MNDQTFPNIEPLAGHITPPNSPITDPAHAAEHLRGLDASASLVRQVIAEGRVTADTRDTVSRNCAHIGIAAAYPNVVASGADLSDYFAARSEGMDWLAANPLPPSE